MSDKEEIRKVIDEVLAKYTKIIDLRFEMVHSELKHIKEQTIKTNSRTNKLEHDVKAVDSNIVSHAIECPAMKEISVLKKKIDEITSIRKFVVQSLAIVASVAVIVTAVFHIIQMIQQWQT